MKNYLITLSEKILLKAQINEDSVSLRRELFYVKQKNLEVNLITDDLRKAFWINIYNAYVLILANETKQQKKLFKQKRIKIARNRLSLNDVEYGILKRYKFKIGSIYIYDPFYSKFIKNIAINQVDVNLHLRLDSNALMDI
ncbi:DUF547 domain-containing protein [Flavobacterium sp. 83]|uniref:DUF547 domain-containing protein n=1 Tax=Flavobacterium sp. 83 TaxID=1131812 RepID=UPI000551F0FB|nr:DUF547 domain-containing protein [Flavobacterium sp. 83]